MIDRNLVRGTRGVSFHTIKRFRSFKLVPRWHLSFCSPVGTLYAHTGIAGYLVGRLNPHGPLRQGKPKFDWTGEAARAKFALLQASPQRIARCDDVAKKLSGLPETAGKEESHRHGRLSLRQVRLERLTLRSR